MMPTTTSTNMTNPDGDIQVVDVTGSLCENNDKFAKNRELPEARIEIPWLSTTQVHMVSQWVTTIMDVFVLQKFSTKKMERLV